VLSITAISAGAVDYLLRGSGCAGHDHEQEAVEGATAQSAGAEYLLSSAAKEPAGVWFGAGLPMVGMVAGESARADDVRAVFGHLRHPASTEEEPEFLGRAPRTFAGVEARIERACAAEPDAGEERRAEIATQVRGDRRKAVGYYDLTFSPVKSVSVYWAALTSQGRHAEAELVMRAHREAIAEAMEWAEGEVGWTRVGYHGRTAGGRSVGRYESATGLVWTRWDHHTNRACEPQLHSHVAVLNRVVTACDGQIRALDGRGFRAVKHGIDAIYAQGYERRLNAWLGVQFGWRPDGRAREILGIHRSLLTEASSRRRDVTDSVGRLIAEYQQRHGYEPSPAVRTKLSRAAALSTRAAKSSMAPGEQIRRWCGPRRTRLAHALGEVAHRAGLVARDGHPDQRHQPTRSLDEVLRAAVEVVQASHATWDVGLLQKAIGDELTHTPSAASEPLPELTARVLADPRRFGIVLVSASDPVPVPERLRRADGKSIFRAHHDERYTTTAQLSVENGIVVAARAPGAPTVDPATARRLPAELDSAGLAPDQVAAVVGIVSSGRAADVLIGPAGTGKSHTVGVLAHTWRRHLGGRVIGLATSQIAAMELADNGLEAMNTTRFLTAFADSEKPAYVGDRVRPGDLVVLDEVGMTSTAELAQIAQLVTAAGGKLLFTGDHQQLAAIGAGGMLNLLVTDNGCYTLTEIHRFTHDWERSASTLLRAGDTAVLDVYERNGRLVGGNLADLAETAVRGYLADTITGHQALLVTASNEQATELSGRIHDELVRLGHVHPQALSTTRDGNPIGAGDLIQARRNDPTIQVDGNPAGGGMVTNRLTYRVLGRDDMAGVLRAADSRGRVAHLPPDYVSEHVSLAYASTVHAAQGRTVDTCHALIEPHCDRRSAYVALTRGKDCNTAYVVCEQDPDGHRPERLACTARAQLAAVVSSVDDDTITAAAELVRRAGIDEARSLASVATQWDLVAGEVCRDQSTAIVSELLDPATAHTLLAEPGYPRLVRAIRAAGMAGHDTRAILTEAIESRSLFGADYVSDVLRWRISIATGSRIPEHDTSNAGWAAMTPAYGGQVGEYLDALAAAADDRRRELGHRALAEQPAWATTPLGPPPANERDRNEWVRRAGVLAAYRDLRGLPEETVSLGPAPPREQVLHRALWTRAHTAAGAPTDQLDYSSATETQLRQMRATYHRELTWAPYWVHDELRDAQLCATGYQQDAALWNAEAQLLTPGTPERARADADTHSARQLAALYQARVEQLQVIDAARRHWHHDTDTVRTRFEHAGNELDRRGLPRDLTPNAAQQPPLLDVPAGRELSTGGSAQKQRQPAPAVAVGSDTAEPAVEESRQTELFALAPDPRDLAATSPLRQTTEPGISGRAAVTLAEALRHAEITTDLRAQHGRWTDALDQLEQQTLSHRDHDEHAGYQRRSRDTAEVEVGQDHDHGLDLGAEY
jgi:conjugative relaxase-like TrwC/TraI family protein